MQSHLACLPNGILTVELAGVERLSVWCGSCGQLERCSSEGQSVAQTDRRNRCASKGKSMFTVNAACVEPAGMEEVS